MPLFWQNAYNTTSFETSQGFNSVVDCLKFSWDMDQRWCWRRRGAESALLNRIPTGDIGGSSISLLQVGRCVARGVVEGIHDGCGVWKDEVAPTATVSSERLSLNNGDERGELTGRKLCEGTQKEFGGAGGMREACIPAPSSLGIGLWRMGSSSYTEGLVPGELTGLIDGHAL